MIATTMTTKMIALAIVFTEAPNSANEVRKLRPFSRLGQSKRLRQEIRRGPARSPSASEAGSHSRVTSRNLMALFQSARTRLDGCVWRLAVGRPFGSRYSAVDMLDPKNDDAYNNRGAAYDNKGDQESAIANYREALKIKPANEAAKLNLKRLRTRRLRRNPLAKPAK